MKNYIFKFTGRKIGSIGVTYPILAGIAAENIAAAAYWLHTLYEHCSSVKVTENGRDVTNYYDVCAPICGPTDAVDMSAVMVPELVDFSKLLKNNGFTVFMYYWDNCPKTNYFSFSNGRGFGYVQQERLGGSFSFSSLHLPNRTTGTAYGFKELTDLTIQNAHFVCDTLNPYWASHNDRTDTKPYENISGFLRVNKNCFIF